MDDQDVNALTCLDDDGVLKPLPLCQKLRFRQLVGYVLHMEIEGEPLDTPEKWLDLKWHTFHSWSTSMEWRTMPCFKASQTPVDKPVSLLS